MHPNTFRCSTIGLSPVQASYGVIPLTAFVGLRFLKYVAVDNASPQNLFGKFDSHNIDLTHSSNVLFILSATPFCSGVFGTVNSCRIPSCLK